LFLRVEPRKAEIVQPVVNTETIIPPHFPAMIITSVLYFVETSDISHHKYNKNTKLKTG
jgi:hypothetical protein